jgi:CubicO group peptidase (beta-lactamase class C family)
LLGAIIEKASGKTYAAFLEQNIFEPLGMKGTSYEEHARIIPQRARGYGGTRAQYQNAQYLSMTQPYAAGSLVSTVDDLALWDAALRSDRLLTPASRTAMVTPFRLNDGSSTEYGYGLAIGELRGRPSVSHGGGIFGFSTFALRLPEERVYVAVLSNNTALTTSPGYVAQKVAALVIGDPFPERQAIELAPEVLERYTGIYRIDADATRTVTLEGGQLHAQRTGGPKLPIVPESETEFFYPGSFSHLSFVVDPSGGVTSMLFYQDDAKPPERADRSDEPLP